jgi:hypothetical protein
VKVRLNKLAFHFLQQRSATLAKKALEGRTFTVDEEGLQAIQKVYEDARAAARRELRRRPVETLGEIIVDE